MADYKPTCSSRAASMSFLAVSLLFSLFVLCRAGSDADILPADISLALVHYAKANDTPQQTTEEILVTEKVLRARGPCNFLVFGLGYDTLLWQSLNHGGRTVFLEESESWLIETQAKHSKLEAYLVTYSTQLLQQEELLKYSRDERNGDCRPRQEIATSKCRLAMTNLPPELYKVDWDVILIDAPQGWFPEAPGRMAAIFSIAVLARSKNNGSYIDIMLHDVDRPTERSYADEFLCNENRVGGAGKLLHYQIAPSNKQTFCAVAVEEKEDKLYVNAQPEAVAHSEL